jgi:thioesterase domain-containing protein
VEDLATRYVDAIRTLAPRGPYRLLGHSLGAIVCFEMAHRLTAMGERVELLAMVDALCPPSRYERAHEQFFRAFMGHLESARLDDEVDADSDAALWTALFDRMGGPEEAPHAVGDVDAQRAFFARRLAHLGFLASEDDASPLMLRRFLRSLLAGYRAVVSYAPRPLPVPIRFLRAGDLPEGADSALGWSAYATAGIETVELPGDHFSVLSGDQITHIATPVQRWLDAVDGVAGASEKELR